MLMQIIKNNSGKKTQTSNRKSKFTEGRLRCISNGLFICLIKNISYEHTIIIFLSGQTIYTYFMQFVIADHPDQINNHTRARSSRVVSVPYSTQQ